MNKIKTRCSVGRYLVFLMSLLILGCGVKKQVLEDKLHELERETTRLKAENANLASRKAVLDDKLLLIEKAAQGTESTVPLLNVVKLTPEPDEYVEDQIVSFIESPAPKKEDKGKRPVLSLMGYAPRTSFTGSAPKSIGPPNVLPSGLSGDNLGVVAKNGVATVNHGVSNDPMEQFQEAYRAYSNKQYQVAEGAFSRFLANNVNHGYADNAMFWRGECFLAQGKLLKAIGEYERLIRRFPRSEKGPSTLYRIGFVYDKMYDYEKAGEYYFKVVDRHPGSDAARKASSRVAALKNEVSRGPRLISTSAVKR